MEICFDTKIVVNLRYGIGNLASLREMNVYRQSVWEVCGKTFRHKSCRQCVSWLEDLTFQQSDSSLREMSVCRESVWEVCVWEKVSIQT